LASTYNRVPSSPAKARPDSSSADAGDPWARLIGYLTLLWGKRGALCRATLAGLMLGTLLALLLPKQYQSTVQLMPPDTQSSSSAMLAA
jgi:uncharacterized protein involved in exopolysaccharide biosynthesis